VASPLVLLVTGKVPSDVLPLKAWICVVNCDGPSAWINAPMPATEVPTLRVSGPLPLLPVSEVQIRVSPAVKPTLFQLHDGDAGHTTDVRLPVPPRVTATLNDPTEVAVKLEPGGAVASAPSCDQWTKSLAF
jgi:hypothetical protein